MTRTHWANCVEPALRNVTSGRQPGPTAQEYLLAIRTALASDIDISEELHLMPPDATVREYLRVVEARLSERIEKR